MPGKNEVAEKLSRPAPATRAEHYTMFEDAETLPGGEKIEDLADEKLARALRKLRVPGAQDGNSRQANEALYQNYLWKMFQEAGNEAVMSWRLQQEGAVDHDSEDQDSRGE